MKPIVLVDAVRTPQGILGGALKSFTNQTLGQVVVRALLERSRLNPQLVDEVIFGCVAQQSDASNVARVISLMAGIPYKTTAFTVSRNCASGLQSVVSAYQLIACGDADVVIAGGTECMSSAPYANRDLRFGKKLRHSTMVDTLWEGLTDPICNQIMGETAENLAEEFEISRKEQDEFAALSHRKASQATCEGKFKEEIVKVTIRQEAHGKKMPPVIFSEDEAINADLTEQALSQYPTIFRENGTVTPGNSCPVSDGAAALLVMSADKAKELGYVPLGYIRSYGFAGVEPHRMGVGPAYAVPVALKRSSLTLKDIQLIELNESFAAQFLACERMMNFDRNIVNVNGGAIALGHPVGATGARLLTTLLYEMKRRNVTLGLVAMCVGGGQGGAMIIERK